MANDPLSIMAESYRSLAETNRFIAQSLHLGRKIQACALILLGLSLLGTGLLIWQHVTTSHVATVQTQALQELLRQSQRKP